MLLDKRQTSARQNWSCRTIKNSIDLGGLRKISDLCRAAVIGDCRQKVVLHDCAQSHVWTEAMGLALRPIGEFLGGVCFVRVLSLILPGAVTRQGLARA